MATPVSRRRATPTPPALTAASLAPAPVAPARFSSVTLQYGGFSKQATLAEQLLLPVVDFPVRYFAIEAIDRAASERKGVLLIGEKGTGKTIAVDQALNEFRVNEERRAAIQGYRMRHVVRVNSPRSAKPVEIMDAIFRELTGDGLVPKEHGVSIMPDKLMTQVVLELLTTDTAVLVMDEAEKLSDTGLRVLRDLISEAEVRSEQRLQGDKFSRAGVGVVLVGTPELNQRIHASDEHRRRWVHTYQVQALSLRQIAEAYRCYLPCCDREAESRGEESWLAFLKATIASGRLPISRIENHVRHYVRRIVNDDLSVTNLEEVPFREQVFLGTWAESGGEMVAYAS